MLHEPFGSLISWPWGVPTSVNFLPLTNFRSPLCVIETSHGSLYCTKSLFRLHPFVISGKLAFDESQDLLPLGGHVSETHEGGL